MTIQPTLFYHWAINQGYCNNVTRPLLLLFVIEWSVFFPSFFNFFVLLSKLLMYIHRRAWAGYTGKQKRRRKYIRGAHTQQTHTQNGGTILRRRVTKSKGAITQQMRGEKKLGINRTERKRETGRERWFNEHTWWHRQPDEKPFFLWGQTCVYHNHVAVNFLIRFSKGHGKKISIERGTTTK